MIKYLNLIIVCPKQYQKNNVSIRYTEDVDGVCIHAPFIGCDFYTGSEACVNCVKSLNRILFKNQELYKSTSDIEITL